jgi:hypothetical protein
MLAQAMKCAWRLHWWRRPHGRALELLLCELHARKHGGKVRLDSEQCVLHCGSSSHSGGTIELNVDEAWGRVVEGALDRKLPRDDMGQLMAK